MKRILTSAAMILLFVTIMLTSFAQTKKQRTPKWICDKGYWVIESNINVKNHCTVHFYNNDNTKLYSEAIDGKEPDISKQKPLL